MNVQNIGLTFAHVKFIARSRDDVCLKAKFAEVSKTASLWDTIDFESHVTKSNIESRAMTQVLTSAYLAYCARNINFPYKRVTLLPSPPHPDHEGPKIKGPAYLESMTDEAPSLSYKSARAVGQLGAVFRVR